MILKNQQTTKKHAKLPPKGQRVNLYIYRIHMYEVTLKAYVHIYLVA